MKLILSALLVAISIGAALSISVVKMRELVAEHNILPVKDVPVKDSGKHWALIVAGSNTWYNYRHQVSNAN